MRLGFYYHVPAELKNGVLRMPGFQGCFIDSLARECEKVVCFLHTPDKNDQIKADYQIKSANVEWVNLGPRGSALRRSLAGKQFIDKVNQRAHDLDILLIRGPSPLLPALAAGARVATALLLVGDYVTGVSDLPQQRWRKELIRAWSMWNKRGQTRAARKSLTFVNSRVLFDDLKRKIPWLHEIRTTTLTEEAFFYREDTCQSKPIRLLFVGRMDRTKGLLEIVRALSSLVQKGEDLRLDLVGWPEPGDPILDELITLAGNSGIKDRIIFHGPKPLGAELFSFYQSADIYTIASLASEGFPRTIWEAMAHCVPVVATKVGSIPSFIQGTAVLIRPGSPQALAEGIDEVIHNENLRRENIKNGFALARKNTLEKQSRSMVEKMKTWLEGKHGSPG